MLVYFSDWDVLGGTIWILTHGLKWVVKVGGTKKWRASLGFCLKTTRKKVPLQRRHPKFATNLHAAVVLNGQGRSLEALS